MGIELVKAVAAKGGKLPGNEYKVLTYMAAVALDTPNDKGQPARLYYAGWKPLALALGQESVPDGNSPEDEKRRRAQYELVRRAIRDLRNRGLIKDLQGQARIGVRRQTFQLTLERIEEKARINLRELKGGPAPDIHSPADPAGQGALQNSGDDPLQNSGDHPLQIVGDSPAVSAGPRTEEEEGQDLSQDHRATDSASSKEGGASSSAAKGRVEYLWARAVAAGRPGGQSRRFDWDAAIDRAAERDREELAHHRRTS